MKGNCDDCGQYSEELKFWHTGARLCPICFKQWDDKDKKMREELRTEFNQGDIDKFVNNNIDLKEEKKQTILKEEKKPTKKKNLEDWF